jgi:predicted CXXCH cytochrome family protein
MGKLYVMIMMILFTAGLCFGQNYVGSDECKRCHGAADVSGAGYNIHEEVFKSGHPYKLNMLDGSAPSYPANTTDGVPNPPEGHSWSDFSYVIGGYGWKARFVDTLGYVFTGDELSSSTGDSVAQYNLDTKGWVTYHKGEAKKYDYGCFVCHTTGPSPEGSYIAATPGLGTFAEPGIGCEGCHGPGSDHVDAFGGTPLPVDADSLATARCSDCHQRGGKTNAIPASGGYIKHHEQINEMRASKHGDGQGIDLECGTCHDTHFALLYPDATEFDAIKADAQCESCHGDKVAMPGGEDHPSFVDCIDCHMPEASKSAVAHTNEAGQWGDVKTHIMAINTDNVTSSAMFTEDGGAVKLDSNGLAAVTLDYICLRCHSDKDIDWASANAQDIHGIKGGDNYYLGVGFNPEVGSGCSDCHEGVISEWDSTLHAVALVNGEASSHFGYSCLGCHTTGWDTETDNWGADEYVTEEAEDGYTVTDSVNWMAKANVQCETCHGAVGLADSTIDMGHTGRQTDLSAELCGACHTGSHHPTWDEWAVSKHAFAKETTIPGGAFAFIKYSPSCSGCHTAEGFLQYLNQEMFSMPDVDPPGDAGNDLTCAACHDPHSNENPGQLRVDPVNLCDWCHNPIYNPDAPEPDGSDLHHTTAFMFDGNGGWEYGQDIGSSVHTFAVADRCVECHVNMEGEGDFGSSTGHTFEPRTESCAQAGCHGENYYTLVDTSDHDNKFNLYGVQTEMDSLMHVLEEKLMMATSEDSATDAFLNAKWNWDFAHAEGSHGVHNTKYARGLLEASITDFTPTGIEDISESGMPLRYSLDQNYPNPFNPSTEIQFSIKQAGKVVLKVYDITGREVITLVDKEMAPGSYSAHFNASNLATGVYIYRIMSHEFVAVKKMVLIK